jgi:hypothetical protein
MTDSTPQPNIFLDLIVAFLAPMFLAVTGGNITHARAAAIETVNAYRTESNVDLLTVAQIIAFGIAALGSLSLSMADDLSISLILRLRGSAVSSNRAAEQCRRALARPKSDPAPSLPAEPEDPFPDEATIVANVAQLRAQTATPVPFAPAPKPSPISPADTVWANAMIEIAAEITAGMPSLPPAERRGASIQAAALSDVARDLLAGQPTRMPPGFNLSPVAGPA